MGLTQNAAFAAAPTSNEIMSGVTLSARHDALLAPYLFNLSRGPSAVRDLIVSDMRGFLDLGLNRRAADLLIVLRVFLAKYPEAARVVGHSAAIGACHS